MTISFYLVHGLMLGFEYVDCEDAFVIDLGLLRIIIQKEEDE